MRAGTVHAPLLSWQNQSPHAAGACKQVAVISSWTARLLPFSRLSARKRARTNGLEKQIGKSVLKTSHAISYSHFDKIPSPITAYLFIVKPHHSAVRSHFLYISVNLGGTAANYNLEVMNYGVRPHRVLLCPWINLSDFPPTVRMDFLLNDFMRKKLQFYICSQHQLLWRFIAVVNVNIPSYPIISNAEATVGQPMGFPVILVISSVLREMSLTIKWSRKIVASAIIANCQI